MSTLYENYSDTDAITEWAVPFWQGVYAADFPYQTFTPQINHVLTRVDLYQRKTTTASVNFRVANIYATDGTGRPTGSALAGSGVLSGYGAETFDWRWESITIPGSITLTAGVTYAVVFYMQADSTNKPMQWARRNPGLYSGGQIWHYVWRSYLGPETPLYPGGWEDGVAEGDLFFREYGDGPPEKAVNPTPTNIASDTTLDQETITWENGGGATSYDVYYGTVSGDLTLLSSGQTGLSFTISGINNGSPFGYEITRYWRIDSVNAMGVTEGDEWSFTTLIFDPPTPSVNSDGDDTGENNMLTVRRVVAAANNKMWIEI